MSFEPLISEQSNQLLLPKHSDQTELEDIAHARSRPCSPSECNAQSPINRRGSPIFEKTAHHGIAYSYPLVGEDAVSTDVIEMEHLAKPEHQEVDVPHPPQRSRSRLRHLVHTWRWELCVWMLGTAGLIANIALLIRFNSVQQRAWHSNVQITAFVAALAQLSQSALLVPIASSIGQLKWKWLQKDRQAIDVDRFDLASRGPDGALRLLWHLKLGPHLVSLGAVSTILMLVFPTFVQQSVAVNTRHFAVPEDGATYIQRASQALQGLRELTPGNSLAFVQATVGDYADPANVTGNCPTGSCTWKPYDTLSICASTKDISESLIPGNTTMDGSFYPPTVRGSGSVPQATSNTTFNTYVERPVNDLLSDKAEIYGNSALKVPTIARVHLVFFDPCKRNEDTPFDPTTFYPTNIEFWTAMEAEFRACVQTFNSSYEGSFQTEIQNSKHDRQWLPSHSEDSLPSTQFCTSVVASNDTCMSFDLQFDIQRSLRDVYNFSGVYRGGWYEYFSVGASQLTRVLLNDTRKTEPLYLAGEYDYCQNDTLKAFNYRAQNIAASLSIELRKTDNSTTSRANGTAWYTEPVIEVAFAWLSLPVAIYISLTAFFFATMITTSNAPPWKSSAIALLRCADYNNKMASTKQFKQFAKSTVVRLEDNGETWHLLETQEAYNTKKRDAFTPERDL